MGVRKFRSISILVLTFFLIIFLALRGFISKPSCFTFLQSFCFLIPLFIGLYRGYSAYRSMFSKSGGLVEKERVFTINNRCIDIFCENDVKFCGRYFLYDLLGYYEDGEYIYLFFCRKMFIIIPRRCLTEKQYEYIILILHNTGAKKEKDEYLS